MSEDNFAPEDRSNLDILIREALQNPLDARAQDNAGTVTVRITVLQPGSYDSRYLSSLLPDEYRKRLKASGGEALADEAARKVLVIEDFGTTGLEGAFDNPNQDGAGENWNAFWFREGEGAKATAGSNGRAGQGKITYYRAGAARAVFGLTVRKSDGNALLMGRSAFRRAYPYGTDKYVRHSFWCTGAGRPLPIRESVEQLRFAEAFHLERGTEPGLSLVIPAPLDFIPKDAIRIIVAEFYYPIARGRLEVSIGGLKVAVDTVDAIAERVLPDEEVRQARTGFTAAFRRLTKAAIDDEKNGACPVELKRGWDKLSSITEDMLPDGSLQALRASIVGGNRVAIRCPVTIRQRSSPDVQSIFDVHLRVPEDLARVEEAYIRRDLLIGSERHLATPHLQKAMALTLIQDNALSAFLADAEEPTHLKWNGSRPRLTEDYSNPASVLRTVRHAAPRILALLLNGVEIKDTKALAKYFTRPAEDSKRTPGGRRKPDSGGTGPEMNPPEPKRKPFRIVAKADQVVVLPNGNAAFTPADLPLECTLEIAYEGLDQDPFRAYDPFDFDLSDVRSHSISSVGAAIVARQANRVRFAVKDPKFEVKVPGFDPHIRLRARLSYEEKKHGANVSEE